MSEPQETAHDRHVLHEIAELRRHLDREFQSVHRKLDRIMSQQADIDAAVQALTGMVADVQTQQTALGQIETSIQSYIQTLQAQNVDTSQLDAIVAQVQAAQSGL